jgi:hypothetical protein
VKEKEVLEIAQRTTLDLVGWDRNSIYHVTEYWDEIKGWVKYEEY